MAYGLYYLFARSHSKRMYNELDRLKLPFDEHGIKFVVLKGPGLAKSVYRVPATRIFGDLDLLVSPADVYKAHNILINDGYTAYGFQGQHIPQEEVVERMEWSKLSELQYLNKKSEMFAGCYRYRRGDC